MCSCTATTDTQLETNNENDIPTQKIVAQIKSIGRPTNDILIYP